MKIFYFTLLIILFSCVNEQSSNIEKSPSPSKELTAVEKFYMENQNDSIQSRSIGSVSSGKLENASIIPFEGKNYKYFDEGSYLGGRAFTNSTVAKITVDTYDALHSKGIDRFFRVMEFSKKEGGKIFPHRTHQNGLSMDYMMPLIKNGEPYYELDEKGPSHYLLEFDKNGAYTENPEIKIDFDAAALHLLELERQARKNGMRIHKVIFNTYLKDELYASKNGKKLLSSGIYVTRNLSKMINDLHDDHYHVDFIKL